MTKGFALVSGPGSDFRPGDEKVAKQQKQMRRQLMKPRCNATLCPGCSSLLPVEGEAGESIKSKHASSVMHERSCPICGAKWKERQHKVLNAHGHSVWVGAHAIQAYVSYRDAEAPKLKR